MSANGPLTGIVGIQLGGNDACAINAGGEVWCWGENNYGQLGDGTLVDRQIATPVIGL